MDDGPIAGGGVFAGHENLFLTKIAWDEHGNDNFRYTQIHPHLERVGHSGKSGGGDCGSVQGGAFRGGVGDQDRSAGIGIPLDYQVGGNDDGSHRRRGDAGQAALSLAIYDAWADRPWVNEGAAVRVSLICFADKHSGLPVSLDGKPVNEIYADLTAPRASENLAGLDLTQAKPLAENAGISFQGSQKIGAFDIPGELARSWLKLPNINNKPNSDVVKPSWNGLDLTRRPRDGWIIDFGSAMPESEAMLFEAPFDYVVKPA